MWVSSTTKKHFSICLHWLDTTIRDIKGHHGGEHCHIIARRFPVGLLIGLSLYGASMFFPWLWGVWLPSIFQVQVRLIHDFKWSIGLSVYGLLVASVSVWPCSIIATCQECTLLTPARCVVLQYWIVGIFLCLFLLAALFPTQAIQRWKTRKHLEHQNRIQMEKEEEKQRNKEKKSVKANR